MMILCLSGCQTSNSAQTVVTSYLECMQDGDAEKAKTYLVKKLQSNEQTPEEIARSSGQSKAVQDVFVEYMKHIVSLQWSSYEIKNATKDRVVVMITGIDASDLQAIDTSKETETLRSALDANKNEVKVFKKFYSDSQRKVDQLKKVKRTMVFTVKDRKITTIELR